MFGGQLSSAIRACLDNANPKQRFDSIYLACLPKGGYQYVSSRIPDSWQDMNDENDIAIAWKSLEPDQRAFVFREFESRSEALEPDTRKKALVSLIETYVPVQSPKRPVSKSSNIEFPEVWVPIDTDGSLREVWRSCTPRERKYLAGEAASDRPLKTSFDIWRIVREIRNKKDNAYPKGYATRKVEEIIRIRLHGPSKAVQMYVRYGPMDTDAEWVDAEVFLVEGVVETLRETLIRVR